MKMRVLIADSDPALLASYRDFLVRQGFEVALARDGLDCLAQLRSTFPDVLVLEPELPWGQGDGVLALMEEADGLAARIRAKAREQVGPSAGGAASPAGVP